MNADPRAAAAEFARLLARALVRVADEITNGTTTTEARPSQATAVAKAMLDAATKPAAPTPNAPAASAPNDDPPCPVCSGKMWDNRLSKKNPKAPDYKCRDKSCDGVIWPPREEKPRTTTVPMPVTGNAEWVPVSDEEMMF